MKNKLDADLRAAMKAKVTAKNDGTDTVAVDRELRVQRALQAALASAATAGKERKELEDADVLRVLTKEAKTRRATAEEYKALGEASRASEEDAEAQIIERYLPTTMNEAQTRALVSDLIEAHGLAGAGPKGIGRIMGALKHRTDVDRALVSRVAKELLD